MKGEMLLRSEKRKSRKPDRYSPSCSDMQDDGSDCWDNISLDSASSHLDETKMADDDDEVEVIDSDWFQWVVI